MDIQRTFENFRERQADFKRRLEYMMPPLNMVVSDQNVAERHRDTARTQRIALCAEYQFLMEESDRLTTLAITMASLVEANKINYK